MSLFGPDQVTGDMVQLKRTDPLHMDESGNAGPLNPEKSSSTDFQQLMLKALDGVNATAQKSFQLEQQAIIDPQSVDAHDLTIALGEANLAISITKAVTDRVIRAYQDIINAH